MIESGQNSDKQNKYNRLVRETKKITGSKEGKINCSHLKEGNRTQSRRTKMAVLCTKRKIEIDTC